MPTPEETIARLEGQIQELRSENAERRTANRDLKAENTKLKTDIAERETRLADFESKQGKPSQLAARIEELTSENRQLKHSARFRDLADKAGVIPEAIEDAWSALKLKADSDEPDDSAMDSALEAAKTAKPYLFKPTADPKQVTTPTPTTPPPFGGGRGKDAPGSLRLTIAQRRDPKFMTENKALIGRHRDAGTLIYD